MFIFSAGLDGAQRLLVAANSQAALQTMMNQQNAAAMRGAAPLGGAPLILSPRLQVPTSLASGLLNGSGTAAGPPPLIGMSARFVYDFIELWSAQP